MRKKEEMDGLTYEERNRREELKSEVQRLAMLEEISWRQKSRAL